MATNYEPRNVPQRLLALGEVRCGDCKVTVKTDKLSMPNRCLFVHCPINQLLRDEQAHERSAI